MRLKELKEIIDEAIKEDPSCLECIVVMPMKTDLLGMYAFEEVCPAVTGMITVGPMPEYVQDHRDKDSPEAFEMPAFLVAPHSHHGDEHSHEETKKTLN